jgi:multicomponent Na+:H+ antiporter subunit B
MREYLVLRVITKLLFPYILLFALYVQFHGDFGPGGGFQAGVIFAASFILYSMVFGVHSAQLILPDGILRAGIFCSAPIISITALWRPMQKRASISVFFWSSLVSA